MPNIQVSVINASTVVTDAECASLTAALQRQVSDDFAPVWGIDAAVGFVASGGKPQPNTWWLSILDTTDQAGVVGHHDLTPGGLPLGKVFAATDKHFGLQWTVTASHELLEMLADPDVSRAVVVHTTSGDAKLYAYEVCDPCQDDSLGYEIDGIIVGDFVYPSYFQMFHGPDGTQFDHRNQLKAPVPAVLSGGYLSVREMNAAGSWRPVNAATVPGGVHRTGLAERPSHRRNLRARPRAQWCRSTAFAE
jgi:hypothetical protein